MPLSEGRKRTYSELQDVYAGPEDFMEAGVRGFLITTVPEKEELATDQALKMLRKASVKLFGGYKPAKNTTALFSCGYIAVDFMDPEAVTVLPNPDLQMENPDSKQDQDNTPAKENGEDVKEEIEDATNETDISVKTENEEKMQTEEKGENKDKEEAEDKGTEKPKETGEAQEQEKEMETETQDEDTADRDKKDESNKDDVKREKEAGGDNKNKDGVSKTKESLDKGKSEGNRSKYESRRSRSSKEEDRRSRDHKRKRKQEDNAPKWQLMKAPYKFKAFRTELRNILFIKSNIPDPTVLTDEIMDLLDKRKPLKADAIYQILPIQGVCNYSYWELEVMSRRVLAPFFQEDQEEAPSFGILMFDKMSDPGADVLSEIVRSAIWSLNPNAWQNHPICQPTIVIHLELIGSKIAMSAMPNFMRYRQYSPFFVAELGEGRPEVQDDPDKVPDTSDKDKEKDRSEPHKSEKNRSRSQRPHKDEDGPSGKGNDKDNKDRSSDREKSSRSKSNEDDSKKSEKEKMEQDEKEKKEEDADKPKEEAAEAEEMKDEEKKTPTRRGGRRTASQKKKN